MCKLLTMVVLILPLLFTDQFLINTNFAEESDSLNYYLNYVKQIEEKGPESSLVTTSSFENNGFESGRFSGWVADDNGVGALNPWSVCTFNECGWFLNNNPIEGSFDALNGFDGSANYEAFLYQDIIVPDEGGTLSFQDRIQYDSLEISSSLPRIYEVQVRDLDNNILDILHHQEVLVDRQPQTDLGWQKREFNLSSFRGSTIRIYINLFVPEEFTGPGQIEFDDFKLGKSDVLFAPTANFSNNLSDGPIPLTVEFSDESTGDVREWLWVFGDGGASSEQNPSYTYDRAGIFSVILTVNGSGGSDTIIKPELINVSGAPVANFEANVTAGFAPLAVPFNDLSTGSISNWSWDFGDGDTSAEQNPFHEYQSDGIFTVTLTVNGPGGATSEIKNNLIRALPLTAPVAAFSVNATVALTPFEVQFSDLSSGDVSNWLWDFGDGATSTEQSPIHEYKTAGAFTVSLTINGAGGTDIETKTNFINTISIEQPRVEFSATPRVAFEPLNVRFTDLTQGSDLASWLWDFGDGGISSVRSPVHEFKVEGIYSPSLTVSGRGGIGFNRQTNLVIAISKGNPIAEFKASPTVFFLPSTVTFTDISEGDGITSWTWNFGDGGVSSEQNPTHTYNVEGYYTVTLTVSNQNGIGRETKLNLINPVSVGKPLAEFSINPVSGDSPLVVKFSELAEGVIDNFFWDFGDGSTSKEMNPSHTYDRLGLFTVSLTVSGTNGANTRVKENLINVTQADDDDGDDDGDDEDDDDGDDGDDDQVSSVNADFIANPTNGNRRRLEVQFVDSSTGDITSWLWDFGDGTTSTEQSPLHKYKKKGKYSVNLTISGPEGSDTETKTDFITVGREKRK